MICNAVDECINVQLTGKDAVICPNGKKRCIESSDSRSKVKCEERRKKYVLNNTQKRHIIAYKVDGGMIAEEKRVPTKTDKCDFMFVICSEAKTAILIELKGVDVTHALKQIKETIRLYDSFFKTIAHVYARIVVTSCVPRIKATPEYVKLCKMLHERNGNLKICERQLEESDLNLGYV